MKWITRLVELKSSDPTVKKNRNQFFRYMLTVIYKSLDERPPPHEGYPQYQDKVTVKNKQGIVLNNLQNILLKKIDFGIVRG